VIKVLESDFSERGCEETTFSQEDLQFLAKLKDGIRQKQDGHFEIPLPFKQNQPSLPNNKACAFQRLVSLKRRLRRDQQYCADYVGLSLPVLTQKRSLKRNLTINLSGISLTTAYTTPKGLGRYAWSLIAQQGSKIRH
jgi:hypothetical protein